MPVDSRRFISRRFALGAGGLALLSACAPSRVITEDGSIDLLTLLRDKPEHSRFVNALAVSGQTGRIGRQNGAVTLFVPTNQSMNGLPAALLSVLDSPPSNPTAEQRAAAARLIDANAAFGLLRLGDIEPRRGVIQTWDRGRLRISQTGPRTATVVREGVTPPVTVNITRGDILASDGTYHVTSAPILPG